MAFRSGRHFVQIPGPTNVPDRVLRAMNRPMIDHRGPDFAHLGKAILQDLQWVFRTSAPVFAFPSSATGCWEAALVNTLSPGDRVLMLDHGFFAANWQKVAARFDLTIDFLPCDWRRGIGIVGAKQIEVPDIEGLERGVGLLLAKIPRPKRPPRDPKTRQRPPPASSSTRGRP